MSKKWAYYNEFDPGAAAWLRELIKAGHIAPGEVDERSIEDVQPADVMGFKQVHMFAGIGVWSYALRLANFSDDRECWTGSCPCQPFSAAGKGLGISDKRHLWPELYRLISECKPDLFFAEQVSSKDGLSWLDNVLSQMEDSNYATGAFDLSAASFGAPHIRQRLWIVAQKLADPDFEQFDRSGIVRAAGRIESTNRGSIDELADSDGRNTSSEREQCGREHRLLSESSGAIQNGSPGPTNGFWGNADWLRCRDDKWRPVEPKSQPLAHGITGRVGLLRGYGNAICAPVAQAFVEAFLEAEKE